MRTKTVFFGLCLAIIGIPALLTWAQLARTVDARLRQGPFGNSVSIYAAPHTLTAGEDIDPAQVAAELRQSGYSESAANPAGHYRIGGEQIEIYPGLQSFFRAEPARVLFQDRHVAKIILINGNEETGRYSLEPQLMFDLAGEQRQKRSFVHFDQIPKVLVDAVLSAEDKHFFHHAGLDPVRIVKAAYVNMRSGRREQGGSTLTMQLARSLWLDSRKNLKRKVMESLITLLLEQKLSKKEIFESYANWQAFPSNDSEGVTIAPAEGIVQAQQGGAQIGVGVIAGYLAPQNESVSLSDRTDQLVSQLKQENPNLRSTGSRRKARVDSRDGLVTMLKNSSPLGGVETDALLTVDGPRGLLYVVFIAPENRYSELQKAFEQVMGSIEFER